MTEALILAGLILALAALYSSVGHAGASGYLAAMALMGIAPEVMKPTALSLNILVATIATVRFARAGLVDWRLLWPFAVASIPCAFIGGRMSLPVGVYQQVLGVALLIAAANLAWKRGLTPLHSGGQTPFPRREVGAAARVPPWWLALAIGGALGLVSGMVGVGGGIFLSPLILLAGWADPKRTAGVSAAFILVNSSAGLLGHVASLQALPREIPIWAAAAIAGGLVGSWLGARRLSGPTLRRVLAVVLVIAGVKMILA